MFRRWLLIGIVFASVAAQAAPVRIGVSETLLSLPLYVAHSEGFFEKRGVSVEFTNCVAGNRCMRNMLAGETDLATATELPVVFHSFDRNDFAILTSFVSASNDLKIISKTSANITYPYKMRGKTLGYVKGTSSQYVLDLVLAYDGIDPATVTLKQVTPESAQQALAQGEVDALCIWEPFVSRIRQGLGSEVNLVPIPKLYTQTFNLIASQSVIESRPKELERIMLALKDSTQFIQANPDKAKALAAKQFNVSVDLIEQIFDDYRFRLSLTRSLGRTMEGQARWAIREGHINSTLPHPNYTDFVYTRFLKIVEPGAVSWQ